LSNGGELAIKLLKKSEQGVTEFLNEVVLLTSVKHKNLVTLKGCCLHGVQRLLVYEFVENQNLAEVLWGMVTFQSYHEVFACTIMKTIQINIL
jgi:serine/threonine protein kinase